MLLGPQRIIHQSWVVAALLLATASQLPAQQPPAKPRIPSLDELFAEKPKLEQPKGTQWALIICGLPGDEEHRAMYAESVEQLSEALVTRLDFSPENIRVQFGSEPTDEDGPAIANSRGKATREEIEVEIADLRKYIKKDDTVWTIVLGHGHFDGRNAYLNLPGRDVHQSDFAELFVDLEAGRQIFMITTSVSGFFARPLSGKGRIVITATEADREVNETLFHAALAEVLTRPPEESELDADHSGSITLFDLYIAVTRNVAQRYVSEMLLSTEHAQLDDNGDGRGTELQLDYLSEEEGGRGRGAKPPRIRENSDGALSSLLALRWTAEEPSEQESRVKNQQPTANK